MDQTRGECRQTLKPKQTGAYTVAKCIVADTALRTVVMKEPCLCYKMMIYY